MYLLSNSFVTCASGNPLNGDFMIILATDLRRMSFVFASFTSRRKASQTTSTNSKAKQSRPHILVHPSLNLDVRFYKCHTMCL